MISRLVSSWVCPCDGYQGRGLGVNIPPLRDDLNQWGRDIHLETASSWREKITAIRMTTDGYSLVNLSAPEIDWNVPNQWTILVKSRQETRENCGPLPPWQFLTIDQFPRFNNLKLDWRLDESKSLWLWLALLIFNNIKHGRKFP